VTISKRVEAAQEYKLGLKHEMDRDLKAALKAFERAAAAVPDEPRYLQSVGRICEALGRNRQASEWYMRAAQLHVADGGAPASHLEPAMDWDTERAWVADLHPNQLAQLDVIGAAHRLENFLATFGPDASAVRKLALLQGRLKNNGRALELFNLARRLELQHP
jgi:tetratricopeptide (TPR) repeat protein